MISGRGARPASAAANSGNASSAGRGSPTRPRAGPAPNPAMRPPPPAVPGRPKEHARGATAHQPSQRCDRRAQQRPPPRGHSIAPSPSACPSEQPETAIRRLQRAVPAAVVDTDWPDLDAVRLGIAHDLRRRVEPHRLGVQQRAAEHVRMVAFHPRAGVRDQRETRRMALGKPIDPNPSICETVCSANSRV